MLRLFCFVASVPALLRLELPKLGRLLEPKNGIPPANPVKIDKIIRLVDIVLEVGSPIVRSVCLTRGITLYYFLRRAGLHVSICFGMGNVEGEDAGHCWLVRNGEPFLETRDPRLLFTEIYRFPIKDPSL
jgi:hypothetical protein